MGATTTDTHVSPIRGFCAFAKGYIEQLVQDVPDEDMASQSEGVVNHPAWTLAHLAMANDGAGAMLGLDRLAPQEWHDRFGGGSNPTPVRDDYPPKAQLLEVLARQHDAIMKALDGATNEQLDAENPIEMLRDVAPTVRDGLTFFLVAHVAMHQGQLAAWRTANDLPRVLG